MKHGYSNSVKNSLMGRSAKIEPPINAEGLDTSISGKEQPETASDVLSENKDLALAKETISSSETKKRDPGRPTNESRGLKKRKQLTITLFEDMHAEFLALANQEGLSLAKYIERALLEYKENHQR